MLDTIARVVLPRTKIGNLHAMDQYSQDPLSPSFDEGAHNRQDTRDSLFLMADFRVAGQSATHSVRVRNLSAGGLMAEFPDGLAR